MTARKPLPPVSPSPAELAHRDYEAAGFPAVTPECAEVARTPLPVITGIRDEDAYREGTDGAGRVLAAARLWPSQERSGKKGSRGAA